MLNIRKVIQSVPKKVFKERYDFVTLNMLPLLVLALI